MGVTSAHGADGSPPVQGLSGGSPISHHASVILCVHGAELFLA